MSGIWLLSWRHLTYHRWRSAILVACIAMAVFLPVTVQLGVDRFQRELVARAAATPLVMGARGSRVDLTLAALYFRQREIEPVPFAELRGFEGERARAIPINARFTARGHPVVGTTPEYYELRSLRAAAGSLPLRIGDAVLGADVAAALGASPGDAVFSDPTDLYDLSVPPSLQMLVRGVLARTGTPDDDAIFVDIKTCWILEGLSHGHDEARSLPEDRVLARAGNMVDVSPAVVGYQRVTDENVGTFHVHAEESELPLSAIIVVPDDAKAGTLLTSRINAAGAWQVVVPRVVIDELLQFVFKVKAFFDLFVVVLATVTGLMLLLQLLLSMRLRAREMATLHRIGCSRHTVSALYGTELTMIAALALAVAGSGVAVALTWIPDLVRMP